MKYSTLEQFYQDYDSFAQFMRGAKIIKSSRGMREEDTEESE